MVVYFQSQIGPKFFIPARFLPKKYNYFQEYDGDLETSEDCAVCILPLSSNVELNQLEQGNMVLKRIIEKENNGK